MCCWRCAGCSRSGWSRTRSSWTRSGCSSLPGCGAYPLPRLAVGHRRYPRRRYPGFGLQRDLVPGRRAAVGSLALMALGPSRARRWWTGTAIAVLTHRSECSARSASWVALSSSDGELPSDRRCARAIAQRLIAREGHGPSGCSGSGGPPMTCVWARHTSVSASRWWAQRTGSAW